MRTARDHYQAKFLVYRQQPSTEAPFKLESEEGITIKDRELLQYQQEISVINSFGPDIIYVAGWNHKFYLTLAKEFKKKSIPVITGMDNHWQGSAKQQIASLFARFYLKHYFDYIWVPGAWQFSYALKLGFAKEQVLSGLYSADVEYFLNPYPVQRKRFLFVGRLVHHKGVDLLLRSFSEFCKSEHGWELMIVGNGEAKLVAEIQQTPNAVHIPFIDPVSLKTLLQEGGVFVLPSRYEAWGVVVHEAAASGMPIIASSQCGATANFVKNYYNGYVFKPKSDALLSAMKRIASHDKELLLSMSQRSFELSLSITPKLWAAQLISVFNKRK